MFLVMLHQSHRYPGDLPSTSFHARRTAGRQRQVTLLSQVPQQRSQGTMFHAVLLKTSLVWTPADLDAGILCHDVKWTDESTEGPPLQDRFLRWDASTEETVRKFR